GTSYRVWTWVRLLSRLSFLGTCPLYKQHSGLACLSGVPKSIALRARANREHKRRLQIGITKSVSTRDESHTTVFSLNSAWVSLVTIRSLKRPTANTVISPVFMVRMTCKLVWKRHPVGSWHTRWVPDTRCR